ncbi:MAG TPA: adenylate/guanylate cyclase domain-containing protein, partial [Candidatus Ozemobacteraceae bacterium]|nr:adenylate/guanylate cyclase domain-containing protein [Candidatus Ozemobacteraceae bacterium]
YAGQGSYTNPAAIQAQGGVIDRFIGDAIQAVFYPESDPRPPEARAVEAAFAMRAAHTRLLEERSSGGEFLYEIGIGIDSGSLVTGVIGAPTVRLDFSVIGEALQLAGELETASKSGTASRIMASHQVTEKAGNAVWRQHSPGIREAVSLQSGKAIQSVDLSAELHAGPAAVTDPAPGSTTGKPDSSVSRFMVLLPALVIGGVLMLTDRLTFDHDREIARQQVQQAVERAADSHDPVAQAGMEFRAVTADARRALDHPRGRMPRQIMDSAFRPFGEMFSGAGWHIFTAIDSKPPAGSPSKRLLPATRKLLSYPETTKNPSKLRQFGQFYRLFASLAMFDRYENQVLDYLDSGAVDWPWFQHKFIQDSGLADAFRVIRMASQSYGNPEQINWRGRPYYFAWDILWADPERIPAVSRASAYRGGVLVFWPVEALTPLAGQRCLLRNLGREGFQAVLVGSDGARIDSTADPPGMISAAERISGLVSYDTDGRKGWITAQVPLSGSEGRSLVIGKRIAPFSLLPGAFAALLLMLFLPPLIRFSERFVRLQTMCTILLLLIPAVTLAWMTERSSLLERLDRLESKGRERLLETFSAADEAYAVYGAYSLTRIDRILADSLAKTGWAVPPAISDTSSKDANDPALSRLFRESARQGIRCHAATISRSDGRVSGMFRGKTYLEIM